MLTATKTYMMKNPELVTIRHEDITESWLEKHGVEHLGEITRLFFDYDRKFDSEEEAEAHHHDIRNRLLAHIHYRHPIVITESVQPKKVSFHVIFTKDYIVRDGFHPEDEKELFSSIVGDENFQYIDDSVYHKKKWFRLPYGTLEGKPYPHTPVLRGTEPVILSNYALTATDVETIDYSFTPSRINRQMKKLISECECSESSEDEESNKIEDALNAISKVRFKEQKAWFCLAMIMKRYSTVQLFCQISKDSGYEKYNEKSCKKTFESAPACKNLGMLFKWLKEDKIDSSPFFLSHEARFIKTFMTAGTLNAVDCAKTVRQLHPEFLYCSISSAFFQYKQHRWNNIDKGHELRNCITDLQQFMINAILKVRDELTEIEKSVRDAEEADEKDADASNDKKKVKQLDKWRGILIKEKNKLLDTSFRDKIMKECIPLYLDREFNAKKDTDIHLIGFTNGVMDLSERVFRDGRRDDYITLSTGYDFDPKADTTNVNRFLSQIFPDPVLRDFHLKYKAHCLYGSNPQKTILFETNKEGDNGKSTLTTLDIATFGQYAYTLNSSFLSYVDKGGSGAKPDIMTIRGKRLVFINEPNQKLGMNEAALKEFRGNDPITARGLFETKPTTFKNQSKLIIICNKLPTIESDDVAFFKSIKVLDFEAKFSDNAPATEEEQRKACHFMINRTLTFDLSFQQGYMRLLIDTYLENGIDIEFPFQVEGASRAFQSKSDPILSFIRERTKESEGTLTYTELFNTYNSIRKIKKVDFFAQVKTYKMFSHVENGIVGLCFREEGDENIEVEKTQKKDDEFETLLADKNYKKTDKTFKRIQDVIKDWELPKSKSTSIKLKEFFLRNGVTIQDDKSNGHKIFIDY